MICCGPADGYSVRAVLAACAARRWLARNAAGVKLVRIALAFEPLESMMLVSCLPALEQVDFPLARPPESDELGCLLEVLAWCPRLNALHCI